MFEGVKGVDRAISIRTSMGAPRLSVKKRQVLSQKLAVHPSILSAARARDGVGSTEPSDGCLARVGRIAASASMSGAAGFLSGRSRDPVGTAQHVALGNNFATALAVSPQHHYNMSSQCQERKCFNFREFRRHCNVLPMPCLGRPSGSRSY
jgi:hypothetical protein